MGSNAYRPGRRQILGGAAAIALAVSAGSGGAALAQSSSESPAAPAPSEAPASGGIPAWCGPTPITLSVSDGFGGNNWRRITSAEAQAEAKLCPSVTNYIYTDGQGDVQKSISDIQGLAAQGVQAMVVFPDAGEAMLPAIHDAFTAGSKVVPYRVFPGGQVGVDYDQYISTDFCADAKLMANWLVKALQLAEHDAFEVPARGARRHQHQADRRATL
jgi:ribose transport system substrate-binding protein